jgi:transposase InsO family protein
MCERTAARILASRGQSAKAAPKHEALGRFEREKPNELWQMDLKGIGHPRPAYEPFSVLDDATRFSLSVVPLEAQTLSLIWEALWALFEQFGLPGQILSDNGPAFRVAAGRLPSKLDVRLMRLGVGSAHCRPYHPQTQGKVERFHETQEKELGRALRQPTLQMAADRLEHFRTQYNWIRPHESLGMKTPGSLYRPSNRPRPNRLPEHVLPEGCLARKVDKSGIIGLKAVRYRLGVGLSGEYVQLEAQEQDFAVLYCGRRLGFLEAFKV